MNNFIDINKSKKLILVLTSPNMSIETTPYNDVIAIRLNTLNYTTQDLNKILHIKIAGGFDQTDYYINNGLKRVFKALPIPYKADADFTFGNNDYNSFDCRFLTPITVLSKFDIEAYIDDNPAIDITSGNP
jgi:hypothetical protein